MTPDESDLVTYVKGNHKAPLAIMARPRGGNFVYTQKECKQMFEDVEMIGKIKAKYDKKGLIEGVVVGVLEKDNQ